jgi:hypothetical protein
MSRIALVLSVTVFVSLVLLGSFIARGQRLEVPAQPNQEIKPIAAPSANRGQRTRRIREGTKFKDMYVYFQQTGDRSILYTVADNQRFTCLENLELERVLKVIRDKPDRGFWKIEGEFTEFRGDNFILLRRAVIAEAPTVSPP